MKHLASILALALALLCICTCALAEFPVTLTDQTGRKVTIEAEPERIVSERLQKEYYEKLAQENEIYQERSFRTICAHNDFLTELRQMLTGWCDNLVVHIRWSLNAFPPEFHCYIETYSMFCIKFTH